MCSSDLEGPDGVRFRLFSACFSAISPTRRVAALSAGPFAHLHVAHRVAVDGQPHGRAHLVEAEVARGAGVDGQQVVDRVVGYAQDVGVARDEEVYAFSTENWSRPSEEVDALMKLLRNYMKTCLKTAAKNDMKIRVIGDITGLDADIRARIEELEEATKDNGGLNFQIAINYGSRDEIVREIGRAHV